MGVRISPVLYDLWVDHISTLILNRIMNKLSRKIDENKGRVSDAQLKKELPQRKIVVKSDLPRVIQILKAIPDNQGRAKAHS